MKLTFEKNVITVLKMGKMGNVLANVKTSILTNLHFVETVSLNLVRLALIVLKMLGNVLLSVEMVLLILVKTVMMVSIMGNQENVLPPVDFLFVETVKSNLVKPVLTALKM